MPITDPESIVTEKDLAAFYQGIRPYLTKGGKRPEPITIYGMRITNSESSPDNKVTYLEDCAGFTPAHMDFTNDVFDYGSWENAFFMPRPCMLKYDGTVDYYLDPNDYTKKEDGTASDINDSTYGGNAMMEWGQNGKKIWMKIVPDAEKSNKEAEIYIADKQVDSDYTDWPFHNSLGESVDHFYTAIYSGSLISGKLRSISGTSVMTGSNVSNEITYATANNPSGSNIWYTDILADIDLINILLVLISKTTNSQAAFGKGICSGGNSSTTSAFHSGVHNTKGLFYGTNSDSASNTSNAVKVFGMENWWGFSWRRYAGEFVSGGTRYRKLTYGTEDGSTTNGYNTTGSGYINTGIGSVSGSTGAYIKEMYFTPYGIIPGVLGASDSTYYTDGVYFGSGNNYPRRGGASSSSSRCGCFCIAINAGTTQHDYDQYACLSAKPLQ